MEDSLAVSKRYANRRYEERVSRSLRGFGEIPISFIWGEIPLGDRCTGLVAQLGWSATDLPGGSRSEAMLTIHH